MSLAFLSEFLSGSGMLAAAVMGGFWLKGLSRRQPESILVNEGILADMVCVGEVMLLVVGAMLLVRGVVDLV